MSEIAKFDPSTLMEGVRAKIRASFVELIPDDAWNQMVKTEIDNFLLGEYDRWSNKRNDSGFQKIVREELQKAVKEKVTAVIAEFQPNWQTETNSYDVPKMLKDEIIRQAPEMFMSMIHNAVANSIQNMRIQ